MNFEGEVETQVSDQIAAGASYDQNSGKFAPKTLFTRWTAKGGDPFKATATYNVAAATAEVDVEYEKFGSTFSAKFNSARETLITAADACRDFTVDFVLNKEFLVSRKSTLGKVFANLLLR